MRTTVPAPRLESVRRSSPTLIMRPPPCTEASTRSVAGAARSSIAGSASRSLVVSASSVTTSASSGQPRQRGGEPGAERRAGALVLAEA